MPDPVDVAAAPVWPPAFSPLFVDQARALLAERRVLIVVGPVDSRRDRLAAEVADLPEGPSRHRHVARHGEREMPYFAIGQLFRGVVPPDAAVAAAEACLERGLGDLDEPPRVVLVDADLCDPESVDLLVRAAELGALRLVATLTAETLTVQQSLLSAGTVLEVAPLDHATVAELLRIRFGATPRPRLTEALLERSGGSYAVLQDVADAGHASGAIVIRDGELLLDPGRPEPDRHRLTSLLTAPATDDPDSEALGDLVHLAALLGELDVDEARSAVGADVVDRATTKHGGLTTVDGAIVFWSKAEATLVLRSLSHDRRIELFDRFATAFPRTVRRHGASVAAADWWRAAGHLLPVDLAARAAREANLLGHYRRALIYTDPANNDEHAAIVPVERGFALNELGDDTAFLGMFTDLDPKHLSEDELFPYLRGVTLLDHDGDRDRLVARAVSADDPADRRRREAVKALADLAQTASGTGDERVANRLRTLAFSTKLTPGNRAVTFATLAAVLHHSARPTQAVDAAEFALGNLIADRESVSAFHLDTARETHIMALVSALDVPGAERALLAYSSGILARAGSGRIATGLQAYLAMVGGDMPRAIASADVCLTGLGANDPHQIRGWVEAIAAESLVHAGRIDEARDALAAAEQHPSKLPQTDLARRTYIAATYDALAEPEEALDILAEVVDEAQRRGLRQAQIDAAATSVLIGGPPQVAVLLEAVDDLVDPSGAPLFWQAFARAAHTYDIPTIVDLVDRLDAIGARLFAARVAQFVLDMSRRATDLDTGTRDRLRTVADLGAGPTD